MNAAQAAEGATIGQMAVNHRNALLNPDDAALATEATLDAAIQRALGASTDWVVIIGAPLGAGPFSLRRWSPSVRYPDTAMLELDGAATVAALVRPTFGRVYLPEDVHSRTLRWVDVSGTPELLRLTAAQLRSQREKWLDALRTAAIVDPATRTAYTRAALEALPTAVLRVMLGRHGPAAFPVRAVDQGNYKGASTRGATWAPLSLPIEEPRIYARVISMVEGRMESINGYDAGAGISVGPVQINAQRGALMRFLWTVWTEDRPLFALCFGAPLAWAMRDNSGTPELSVEVAGARRWLSGGRDEAAVTAMVNYLHSGDPAVSTKRIPWRTDLTGRFLRLVAWPHVQRMLLDVTAWWLRPGLDIVHAAGIPALDPARPDRDTFVLKALLMSTYVRFSGCLQPLLDALARHRTVADKLAHWRDALASMSGPCNASGTDAQKKRNANLAERLPNQEVHAATVFSQIQSVLRTAPASGGAATEAHPPCGCTQAATPPAVETSAWEAGWDEDDSHGEDCGHEDSPIGLETSPVAAPLPNLWPQIPPEWSAARIFDALARSEPVPGVAVVARPGARRPENLLPGDVLIQRALGEGRLASAQVLRTGNPIEVGSATLFEAFAPSRPISEPSPFARLPPAGGRLGLHQAIVRPAAAATGLFVPPPTPAPWVTTQSCAPNPATCLPATVLPEAAADPEAALTAALTAAGLSTAQQARLARPPLRALAAICGETMLTELFARLRWTAAFVVSHGRTDGQRGDLSEAMLTPRLLLSIPGHFRELARRVADPREAHALESAGWRFLSSARAAVETATTVRWWVPAGPNWAIALPNPLPPLSDPFRRFVLGQGWIDTLITYGDYETRFVAWRDGMAGQLWAAERGTADPGRPFYASLLGAVATPTTTTERAAIDAAWTARVGAANPGWTGAGEALTLTNLRAGATLRQCAAQAVPANTFDTVTLTGIEVVSGFPARQASASATRSLSVLRPITPLVQRFFDAIAALGWNDLVYQCSGTNCFRGNKLQPHSIFTSPTQASVDALLAGPAGPRDAARSAVRGAHRISNHGYAIAIDVNVPDNGQDATRPLGSIDPRLFALFDALGFHWGGCFRAGREDPMHFEYRR